MDFERVLQALLEELPGGNIRYATIGGFALGILGVPRTTDIESLAARYGGSLDWARIEEYYRIFGLEKEAQDLRVRYGHAE